MPELSRVLKEEDFRRGRPATSADLTPYMDIIDAIREEGGVGGRLTLWEGESQRAEKRRMSMAARERGYQLTWRKAAPGELRFVLGTPGEPPPGGRTRRTPMPSTEQVAVEAIMTEDVAAVTGTTAAPAGAEPAAEPRGRRRRRAP